MKTEKLEHVPGAELRKMLGAFIAKNGSQNRAASALGVNQANFNRMMAGRLNPGRKLLDTFGLTKVTVYVLKTKTNS